LAWAVGVGTFFFNFGTLTMFWLFALKYWTTSREVPKLFAAGRQITFSEKSYKVINYIGFLVNLIPCGLIAYYRGKLTAESGVSKPPESLTNTVELLYYTITGLELVSALIMVDALRRI
jgi:hypothetical protein